VNKPSKSKKEKKSFFPLVLPIETYLFYPKLNRAEQKGNFSNFFDRLTNIDQHLENCLLFLNKQNALQYSKFSQTNHVVLKAYVPHTAIQGKIQGLSLKKGVISKTHIHGCFPNFPKGNQYLENPHFDGKNFPPFMHMRNS